MYRIGSRELQAIEGVLTSGKVFRYGIGDECARFEARYARYLGVDHVMMTSSGTTALTAALVGVGVGPGDEVLVPACTYIATAIAVLAAGAIPVIVDVDDTITIDPKAVERVAGPRTRAVIPVHMWGLPCDMDALMAVAAKRKLLVVEDACQCVGGGYKGRKVGAIGDIGAFSFNYYKNMTCGEGGAVSFNGNGPLDRVRCMIDCCRFYWTDRQTDESLFISNGSRASEIEGAIMNVQLERIDGMVGRMRRMKHRILKETADTGLTPIRANSLDDECGTHVMYTLPDAETAEAFRQGVGGVVAGKTGRHVYTEWDPVFDHRGAHHPALNPYNLAENRDCRMDYTKDMCARSLDILNRTVMIGMHPDRKRDEVTRIIRKIRKAAQDVL